MLVELFVLCKILAMLVLYFALVIICAVLGFNLMFLITYVIVKVKRWVSRNVRIPKKLFNKIEDIAIAPAAWVIKKLDEDEDRP
jgi:hypothetical protein